MDAFGYPLAQNQSYLCDLTKEKFIFSRQTNIATSCFTKKYFTINKIPSPRHRDCKIQWVRYLPAAVRIQEKRRGKSRGSKKRGGCL